MRTKTLISVTLILLFMASCTSQSESSEPTLRVAAAASLQDVMEELIPIFEETYDVEVEAVYGSSGKLARQIEQGAPVDVFLSADLRWTDFLQENHLVEPETYTEFATNRLVLITAKSATPFHNLKDLDLSPEEKVAVGNPDSVPAGTYTKQALEKIQLWNGLQGKVVFGSDVRQVLAYVESGEVEYGFVYASDAVISDTASVLTRIDTSLHDSILYPGVIISESRTKEQGRHFLSFLKSDQATTFYKDYGFNPTRGGKIGK